MQKYIRDSRFFLILSAIAAVVMSVAIVVCDKVGLQLWLNGSHTAVGDFFFKYYTVVGEWVSYIIVGLLLFYKAGWASFLLVDMTLSGLIGQGFKYLVNTDRPLTYFSKFAPDIQLPLVDGVDMSEWYSFPSGHTVTFFVLFMTLTVILTSEHSTTPSNKLLSTLFFILALLGGYSRIYLNQHFPEDILGGMLIGVITTLLLLLIVPKIDQTKFWNWNIHQLHKK